jgi:lipoyl-dependent peroxiredoxin subunit D
MDMSLEEFKEQLGEHARDARVNLGNILTEDGAPGLTLSQIQGVALACTYAIGSDALRKALESEFANTLSDDMVAAAKAAASIMAMNNIYYRFMHLADDAELALLPARLRMQVISKPPTDKPTFELMCLAVSAIAGCGNCIKAHVAELKKAGLSPEAAQSAARIAAVIHAAAVCQRI